MNAVTRNVGSALASAVIRFPFAALLVLALAVAFNLVVSSGDYDERVWRLVPALVAGAALSVAGRLGAEARTQGSSPWTLIVPLVGAVIGACAVWWSDPIVVTGPLLVQSACLCVGLAPFWPGVRDQRAFWAFSFWTLIGAMLAILSVVVFIAGLFTALELVRLLFGLGPTSQAYRHILATAFGLIGPLFVLASIPRLGSEAPQFSQGDRLIRLFRPLVEWVAAPLTLLNAAIIHVYVVPALPFAGDGLPDVIWTVAGFLTGVVVLRVAIAPFSENLGAPGRIFLKMWVWLLPIPFAFLATRLWSETAREGIDYSSYPLIVTAAGTLVVLALQLLSRSRGDIRWMVAVPALALVLAAFGPLSVASVVGRSQARIVTERYGHAIGEGAAELTASSGASDLARRLRLVEETGRSALLGPGYRETDRASIPGAGRSIDPPAQLEIEPSPARRSPPDGSGTLRLDGFDRGATSRSVSRDDVPNEDLALRFEGMDLVLRFGETLDRAPLRALIDAVPLEVTERTVPGATFTVDVMTLDGRRTRLRFESLDLDAASGEPLAAQVTVLFRLEEW